MSTSNDLNKNFQGYTGFKYHINQSINNSIREDITSNTPQKDLFFNLKPQINLNNFLLNMSNIPHFYLSDLKSPNKYSSVSIKKKEDIFDPSLFINGYNSTNKNNSEIDQEKNNLNLYFNSQKKDDKKLVGKKRLFKYILSSEKKIKKENNVKINIIQVNLHGYHLINIQIIKAAYDLKNIEFPKSLIKKLRKKFNYFNLLHLNNTLSKNNEYFLDKINITPAELQENNLNYYKGETNTITIIKNYCNDIYNELEKLKNNYNNKKKGIYITKNILLLELLIRNCNLFTNYILKKINSINNNNLNNICLQKINPSNQISPKFILIPPKPSLSKINNKPYINNLPENNNTTAKKDLLWNTNFKFNNNSSENNLFINKQKTLFKAKIPLMNTYKCDFCERVFKNGQALGGHISQSHPKQSNKYKQKIEIRNSRTERRELLYEARRRLFYVYHIDLNYLLKNKRKNEIKTFIKVHKNEYKKELIFLKNNPRNGLSNFQNMNNNEINSKNDINSLIKDVDNEKILLLEEGK